MLFAIFGAALLMSCDHKDEKPIQKWEYNVLRLDYSELNYDDNDVHERLAICTVADDYAIHWEDSLSILGKEGWELVSVYTVISTSFPNFGNDNYVTGIREQTATRALRAILKRPYHEEKKDKATKKTK